jgi:hypothetical protein
VTGWEERRHEREPSAKGVSAIVVLFEKLEKVLELREEVPDTSFNSMSCLARRKKSMSLHYLLSWPLILTWLLLHLHRATCSSWGCTNRQHKLKRCTDSGYSYATKLASGKHRLMPDKWP